MNQEEKMRIDLIDKIRNYYFNFIYIQNELNLLDELIIIKYTKGNILDTNEDLSFFYYIILRALSNDCTLGLARMFDKSKKAMSVRTLIEAIQNNIIFFLDKDTVMAGIESFQKRYLNCDNEQGGGNDQEHNSTQKIINDLIELRDKIYAHNDKKYFGKNKESSDLHFALYNAKTIVKEVIQLLELFFKQLSEPIPIRKMYTQCQDLERIFFDNSQ